MTPLPMPGLSTAARHMPVPEGIRPAASQDLGAVYVFSTSESSAPQPLHTGLPFAPGLLHEPVLPTLLDLSGAAIPAQAEVLARWPDGSVKWLLLDALSPPLSAGGSVWRLVNHGWSETTNSPRVRCQESAEEIVIDTGAAVFTLDRRRPTLMRQVVVAGSAMLMDDGLNASLTDGRGQKCQAALDGVAVEARGPVRATVRLEGRFTGKAPCRWVARVCFFAGTGLVRVRFTLHNPRRARHRGGLWDLGDPGSISFRELALQVNATSTKDASLLWTAELDATPVQITGPLCIYQESSGGEAWQSRNHVDGTAESPCQFRGYRVSHAGGETTGLRASPILAWRTPGGTITATLPEFWQQFPKALEVEAGRLSLGLFPRQVRHPHELQGGEQKTHTAWFQFTSPTDAGAESMAWVHQPAWLLAAPEAYANSGAICWLTPGERKPDARFETLLTNALTGADSLAARRELIDEYGWRHFGEIYADHEQAYYEGPAPIISHYNNQYDVVLGTLLHYLRTGDRRWWDLADPLARHVIDIDIYHTDLDKAAYNGGLFWHTDHYLDAATATHRCYSRVNQKPGQSYGGGPCNEHNYTSGLLLYYCLTGDPNARDAVLSLANWVFGMDDGSQTAFGFVDDAPTGRASSTASLNYHGPGRGCGNSVNALLDAWSLTGRTRYLHYAEELIARSIHPTDDITARDLLNVEVRWSYTVFLTVLARYLDLKAKAGQCDARYSYAQASLRHYAAWMLQHEVPYFDRPDQLEYPTETWAAQEMRKANVLRLAVPHVEEALRVSLLKRAEELANRAWTDLFRFKHPGTARSLAILLVEGFKDATFRASVPPAAPRSNTSQLFGAPHAFVSQQVQVKSQLKSFRGLAKTIVRLASPERWSRLFR